MQVLRFIFILLEVLVLFNVLIFVHELGHFLAARWRGMKVDRFAIWFGKPIWKKKIGGVEYCLGCIPAGGYVSLPQMATMEAVEGKADSDVEELPPVTPLDKIIVAFAGPLFSFGLALAFALIVMAVGRPVSEREKTTTVGFIETNGPAFKAGLRVGDRILSVDGHPVKKFEGMGDSVKWRIVRSEGETIPITVARAMPDGTTNLLTLEVTPVKEKTSALERKSLRIIMIGPAFTAIIADVLTNSPAALAGLQKNDIVEAANGKKLWSFGGLEEQVSETGTKPILLTVNRNGQRLEKTLVPAAPITPPNEKPMHGIAWLGSGKTELSHPGAIEQVKDSVNAMVQTFGALFSPKSDIKAQHLGGAVKIIEVYWKLFDAEQGWRLALWFSVLMNVNLAILNMLPIPVLDGGHITLALIEAARRKPLNERILKYIQTAFAVLVIGFMLYIFFYDSGDLIREKRSKNKEVEIKFAPPK
ncbi:MAG TPA: RIP metalloprotease RseP [Candidatus Acidoferrum sp.]|nr:RIP metalloprotease RseP [Candidatus Acidoferrum sp.]